jgi:hypothetical protein
VKRIEEKNKEIDQIKLELKVENEKLKQKNENLSKHES